MLRGNLSVFVVGWCFPRKSVGFAAKLATKRSLDSKVFQMGVSQKGCNREPQASSLLRVSHGSALFNEPTIASFREVHNGLLIGWCLR